MKDLAIIAGFILVSISSSVLMAKYSIFKIRKEYLTKIRILEQSNERLRKGIVDATEVIERATKAIEDGKTKG